MRKNKLSNEQLGSIYCRVNGLVRKIEDGGLDYQRVVNGLQALSEGKMEKSWREEDRVIHFSVTSDGTSGEGWIKRLENKGFRPGDYAKRVLRSSGFKQTNGVTTEVAVLKGLLFLDSDRVTSKIREYATIRNLSVLNAEVACLIREKFTDEELEAMGLWWVVVMHEPIEDSGDDPHLLSARRDDGGQWLGVCGGRPVSRWFRESGFAFAVSQVSSQH